MDPSRTLVTFLFETDPSITTVQLIGSWDNFASCYPMDRDTRRGRGHWRGCHSLQDQVCDGAGSPYKKQTGLAMGHTYYYYYEVNGSTEMCDPAMPSTTSCPYLPGQKVNTLYIPQDSTSRNRCASLSSLSEEQFRTMDPRSKFATPQPAAPSHADLSVRRTGTAAPALSTVSVPSGRDSESSSASPAKSSWKRFFHKTLISRPLESRGRPINGDDHRSLTSTSSNYDIRPLTASEGTRTRDISPESLRRFLCEEMTISTRPTSRGSVEPSAHVHASALDVLDQVDEEDDDNLDGPRNSFSNFGADEPLFTTRLSPPSFRRGVSPATATSSSAQTVVPSPRQSRPTLQTGEDVLGFLVSPVPKQPLAHITVPESPSLSGLDTSSHSACPSSTVSSAMNSPVSPTSGEFPSFYDESMDDEDEIDERFPFSGHEDVHVDNATANRSNHVKAPSTASFSRYCLPQLTFSTDKVPADNSLSVSPRFTTMNSPLLLAQSGEPAVGGNGGSNLLGSSLDMGLDDFATELSWMADSITSRRR